MFVSLQKSTLPVFTKVLCLYLLAALLFFKPLCVFVYIVENLYCSVSASCLLCGSVVSMEPRPLYISPAAAPYIEHAPVLRYRRQRMWRKSPEGRKWQTEVEVIKRRLTLRVAGKLVKWRLLGKTPPVAAGWGLNVGLLCMFGVFPLIALNGKFNERLMFPKPLYAKLCSVLIHLCCVTAWVCLLWSSQIECSSVLHCYWCVLMPVHLYMNISY